MNFSSLFIYRITNENNGNVLFSCNPTIAEQYSKQGFKINARKESKIYIGGKK